MECGGLPPLCLRASEKLTNPLRTLDRFVIFDL
jgi:hypothetical protein